MAGKHATNVTIAADLLTEARREGIDLSTTLEDRLREILAARRGDRWRRENREAVESFNAHLERDGTFGDDYRTF